MASNPKALTAEGLVDEIGAIDARIAQLRAEAKPLRDQVANIDRQMSKLGLEKAALEAALAEKRAAPRVSDHAVIRYLERKHGFSFEDVRAKLLTPAVRLAMDMGAEGVKIDGGTLKLKGKCVVTYV